MQYVFITIVNIIISIHYVLDNTLKINIYIRIYIYIYIYILYTKNYYFN